MDSNQIDSLILSNLKGVSTEMEDKALLEWIDSSSDNLKYYTDIKAIWYATMPLASSMPNPLNNAGTIGRNSSKNAIIRRWSYAFAAFAVVAFMFVAGYKLFDENRTVTVENNMLATMKIDMPEGSTIWLSEGSSITYKPKTYKEKRRVQLIGEADLEIMPNRLHPFVLNGPAISITVLGTVFSVRDYPGEPTSETTLAEGAIVMKVKHTNNTLNVGVGQKAVYDHLTKDVKVESVNTDRLSLRRFGIISIESASIDEILSKLKQNYGKNLLITKLPLDSSAKYTFNYPEEARLEDVISLLERITGSKIGIAQ